MKTRIGLVAIGAALILVGSSLVVSAQVPATHRITDANGTVFDVAAPFTVDTIPAATTTTTTTTVPPTTTTTLPPTSLPPTEDYPNVRRDDEYRSPAPPRKPRDLRPSDRPCPGAAVPR